VALRAALCSGMFENITPCSSETFLLKRTRDAASPAPLSSLERKVPRSLQDSHKNLLHGAPPAAPGTGESSIDRRPPIWLKKGDALKLERASRPLPLPPYTLNGRVLAGRTESYDVRSPIHRRARTHVDWWRSPRRSTFSKSSISNASFRGTSLSAVASKERPDAVAAAGRRNGKTVR